MRKTKLTKSWHSVSLHARVQPLTFCVAAAMIALCVLRPASGEDGLLLDSDGDDESSEQHSASQDELTEDGVFYKPNSGLTQVPEHIPLEANMVLLSGNDITDIHAGAFSNIGNCDLLDLSFNKLTEIRTEMWAQFYLHDELNLSFNQISSIQPGAFSSLTYCVKLNLQHNALQQIEQNMWEGLDSLTELKLSFNSITEILPGAFYHLSSCTRLELRGNQLTEIRPDMWEGLDNLQILLLGQNRNLDIQPAACTHLAKCTKLSLWYTGLSDIRSDMWKGLESIKDLDLVSNKITEIRGDMWEGLESLEVLHFSFNDIREVPPAGFSSLPNLKELWLAGNAHLTTLTEDIFDAHQYPDSPGHPEILRLILWHTPLQCDSRLCWMKEGVEAGWLTAEFAIDQQCGNYSIETWFQQVDLDC